VPFGFRRFPGRRRGRARAWLLAVALLGQAAWVPATAAIGEHGPNPSRATPPRPAGSAVAPRPTALAKRPVVDAAPSFLSEAAPAAQPSIQYEEAQAHANDRIDFVPGGRVTTGFTPRGSDRWTVGGLDPRSLPAGRLDGRTMRALAGTGRPTMTPGADPSADAPNADPAATPVAVSASWLPTIDPTSAGLTVQPQAAITPAGLRREVFGFLPYWEINASSLRLDYAKISTIAYFGVGVDAAGNLQKRAPDGSIAVGWSGWTSARMTSIISAAHHGHTRVVLTVQSFGWSATGLARQKALLGSSAARLNLARQIAAAVRDRGADGVNLDLEPLASGYEPNFTALVRTIRAELNRIHTGYQLTFDTTGWIGNYPIENATAPGGADAIFIMGYDYRTSGSNPVGSIAPLDGDGYSIRDTIAAYAARVPASKLILGVPYYGRAWSTSSNTLHVANTSGTRTGDSTTVVYDTAADYLAQHGRHYDPIEQTAWTAYARQNCTATYGCVTSWRELYVDDGAAIAAKYDLVNRYGLRGAGIWALGYDGTRPELWAAIQRKFVTDTTPPTAGIVSLAPNQANPAFTVSWTGRDDVAVASYDVQVSSVGGPWVSWLSGTKATSATWWGFEGRSYAFRVRARDPRGNVGAWNVSSNAATPAASLRVGGFARVLVDGLTIRSAPGTSAVTIGTYRLGATVAIVGGPVSVDGYTWLRVVGPLTEWGPVRTITSTAWVASSGGRLAPAKAPNATRVAAIIGGLAFDGAGAASVGTSAAPTAHRVFSPNGDGSRDGMRIDWTNNRPLDALQLRVFTAAGALVGNVPLTQLASGAQQISWNGKVGGRILADGRYLVTLVGSAGGATFFNPSPVFRLPALAGYGLAIDTVRPVIVSASASGSRLSPNADGILDTVRVTIAATGADGWSFSAAPISGTTVGPAVATGSGPGGSASVTWRGRTSAGGIARDGLYRLTLTVADHAGNRSVRSWVVRVDNTPPTITAAASPSRFSPNADGDADTTRVAWSSSERIGAVVRLYRGASVIRAWAAAVGTAGAVTWAGTDAAGRRVPDGIYTFQIVGRDAAGNRGTRSVPVVVDRTLSSVRWSPALFDPLDGDALAATSRLSFGLARPASVTVAIYQGSTLVRTIWTNQPMAAGPHAWVWNGRNAAGAIVPRGRYTVRVAATTSLGTTIQTRVVIVDAFNVALSATTVRAGQTLTVTFVSTEPLRAAPLVAFGQRGKAAVVKTAVRLSDGRYRVAFLVAAGGSGPAVVRILGRDTAGGTNTTSVPVTVL